MITRLRLAAVLLLGWSASVSAQDSNDLTSRRIVFAAVPRASAAPQIDGDLSDACWSQAREIPGFQLTAGDRSRPAQFKTTARLLFDDQHLYVAFECEEPDPAGLKSTATLHDDPRMEYDDRVEVFLDVNHDHRHYWELAVNPAGVQFDQAAFYRLHGSRTCDFFPEQNLFWRARTKIGADRWTAEIAIDLTSLGLERIEEGTTWGLNLARVRRPDLNLGDELLRHQPAHGAEYSAWVPVQDYINETISNFHAPLEFADAVMGDPGFTVEELQLPSMRYSMGPVGRATEFGWNPFNVTLRTADGQSRRIATELTVEPETVGGSTQKQTVVFRSGESAPLRYYVPENEENKITLRLRDPETGRQLYATSYVETVPPLAEFDLTPLYVRAPADEGPMKVRVRADAATRASAELRLTFRAADTESGEIQSAVLSDLASADRLVPVFDTARLRALPGGDYVIDCRLVEKAGGKLLGEFRQKLTKPSPEVSSRFGVERGNYSFGGVALDGVRVTFPFPGQFVFWRGANYMPWWDMDQMGMSYQSVEAWGSGGQGCHEAMQDRECRFSRVEILESSPARAVVHWRYALSDAHYLIYHNEWVDEYYTFYPDGTGVREVKLWANSNTQHEVLDTIMVKPPGSHTAQMFEGPMATLATLGGKQVSVREFTKDRERYRQFLRDGDDFIAEFHFKDRMHPFLVFSFQDDLMPNVSRGMVSVSRTLFQNAEQRGHWPNSRYAIDGYNAAGIDVPTHFGFGNIHTDVKASLPQPMRWLFLIGATKAGSDLPAAQAKAWLHPVQINSADAGVVSRGYDVAERAYRFAVEGKRSAVKLQVQSGAGDAFHPVLLFDAGVGTLTAVRVAGRELSREEFATGKTAAGETLVFLNVTAPAGATIEVAFAR